MPSDQENAAKIIQRQFRAKRAYKYTQQVLTVDLYGNRKNFRPLINIDTFTILKEHYIEMEIDKIKLRIKEFCEENVKDLDFAILFGSRVLEKRGSDIDFKIFSSNIVGQELREKVAKFACELNKDFSDHSQIDPQDVPYEIKTIIDPETLLLSLDLKAFRNDTGMLRIPDISFSREFLYSQICQMRTILSALTTPNILIAGSSKSYQTTVELAFEGIKTLICRVYNISDRDISSMINLMISSPNGKTYKNYLGYKDNPIIRSYLFDKLKRL